MYPLPQQKKYRTHHTARHHVNFNIKHTKLMEVVTQAINSPLLKVIIYCS